MAACGNGVDRGAGSRPHRRRWTCLPALPAATALLAVGATACGDDSFDVDQATSGNVVAGAVEFEPTPAFLTSVSERSLDQPYRVETSIAMHLAAAGRDQSVEAPIMQGEQDGDRFQYVMDMQEWLDQAGGSVASASGGADPTVEMAGDAETLFIRSPMYAALADQAGGADRLGPAGELAVLGDGWGRVDLTALGELSLAAVQSSAGSPAGADPRALLDLVAGADEVEQLGTDEVDGVAVNGLGADVSMGDMLEAQGTDPEAYVDQLSANSAGLGDVDPQLVGDMMEMITDAAIPFEVWVDGDGYVRRVTFETDYLDVFGGTEIGDRLEDEGMDAFSIGSTLDYSDYGDEGIEIELPPPGAESAVDVTDAYRAMLEAGQAG